jgi:hypothetical protein
MNFPFNFTGIEIIVLFFKIFAIVFSLMYFVYSIIVFRQILTMSKTIQISDTGVVKRENFMVFITKLQILVSFILLIFAVFIVLF